MPLLDLDKYTQQMFVKYFFEPHFLLFAFILQVNFYMYMCIVFRFLIATTYLVVYNHDGCMEELKGQRTQQEKAS